MSDLNDARVEAFTIAREAGVTVDTFNDIWRIIINAYRQEMTV